MAVVAAVVMGIPRNAAAQDLPDATFDWSMPKRTVVDGSGRAVYRTTTAEIAPADFTVEFDACASTVTGSATYRWQVEDRPVHEASACAVSMQLPEGTYRVSLTVVDDQGASAPLVQEVVVQDWLIVAFGDSYGAGEGAPDTPLNPGVLVGLEAKWVEFGSALADVEAKAQIVAAELTDFQQTEAKFAAFQTAWNAWLANANIDTSAAVLAAAVDLGITGIANVGQNLFDAAVAAVDAAEAVWQAAVAAYDAAVAAADAVLAAIDTLRQGLSPDWQDRLCHRSGKSGAFQAARALEDLDPRTSVTLVHLACTGATILEGIIGSYAGSESEPQLHTPDGLPPQPIAATQLVDGREVDAIYVSIGGNDAGFANIVMACMVQPTCDDPVGPPFPAVSDAVAAWNATVVSVCAPFQLITTVGLLPMTTWGECLRRLQDVVITLPELAAKTARQIFDIGINGGTFDGAVQIPLDQRYDLMDGFLFDNPDVGLLRPSRRERLYISEYPDLTRDQAGDYCDSEQKHGLDAIPGWSVAETAWADTFLTPALNGAIRAAAQTHGWTFVTGVAAGYRDKGYCSTDRFIVRLQESLVNQAVIDGAVHPNAAGFSVYGARILEALLPDLYPVAGTTLGRDLTQPRRPDQVPFADAGGDRTVDEGSSTVLANDSWDGDGDAIRYHWTHDAPANIATLEPADGRAEEPTLEALDDGTINLTVTTADEDTDYFGIDPLPRDAGRVTVLNVAPTVAVNGQAVDEDGTATVNGTITDPGTNDSFTVVVDWGDGTALQTVPYPSGTSSFSLSHQYLDDDPSGTSSDTYRVSVTVSDDDGGVDTEEAPVTVHNVDPAARIGAVTDETGSLIGTGLRVVLPLLDLDLSGSFTDVGTEDTHTAVVDWGDGTDPDHLGTTTGPIASSHAYQAPGEYDVTLAVSDDDTGVGTATYSVTVVDPAGAITEAVDHLRALATDPSMPPPAIAAIDEGLGHLVGRAGGSAANGALVLLERGNRNAALEMLEQTLIDLERAEANGAGDLSAVKSLLALIAKSVALDSIERAEAIAVRPPAQRKVDQARDLVLAGDQALAALDPVRAVDAYQQAVRQVEELR